VGPRAVRSCAASSLRDGGARRGTPRACGQDRCTGATGARGGRRRVDTFDLPPLRAALGGIASDAVAIVDGIFLLRPQLANLWSLTIFLVADRQVALERAIARDAAWLGGVAAARTRYATRYFPGETLYLEEADPESLADVVVDNTDPDRPRLVRT